MADKQIIVTVEQDGKKAIITLTPDGNGSMNCKAEWQPAMDKENPQGKDLLAMQILQMLRG